MGCDIHSFGEQKYPNGDYFMVLNDVFPDRSYRLFGFLAGVRNYSNITPISKPRGLPEDVSDSVREERQRWGIDGHTSSWLSMKELLDFDYDQSCEDCRITIEIAPGCWSGGSTCGPGEGEMTTYREFLGEHFFEILDGLKKANIDRVVFWFDN